MTRRINATLSQIVSSLKNCQARMDYCANDVFTVNDIELRIIGFDHDRLVDDPYADTITVLGRRIIGRRIMHYTSCRRGWIDTDLRKYLNDKYINELPKELQDVIRPVSIFTHGADGEEYETHDRLFIPSESEMFGTAIYSEHKDGCLYEAFETSNDRVLLDSDENRAWYWERSATSATDFALVYSYGIPSYGGAAGAAGVPLCFTISYIE